MKTLELLSNRRIWAGIFGAITLLLPLFGVTYELDSTTYIDATVNFFLSFSALATALLPIWSYFKPKK
jgi:hypothetical protein